MKNQTYPNIFVNPYTAEVTGTREFYPSKVSITRETLMGFIFNLHYMLLLPREVGRFLVGILTVVFIVSVLTGLILWWPLTGKWRQALSIKLKSSKERLNFDIHKTSGFYYSIVLLAILVSGISMNLEEEFKWIVTRFSPVTKPFKFKSHPRSEQAQLSLSHIISKVERNFQKGRLHAVYPPIDETGVFVVEQRNVKSLERFVVNTRRITIDQYSGEILNISDPSTGSGGDVFMQWQWPLHSGQAFGMTGRILVLLTGLICPTLFVTGVIRWLQKRKVRKLREIKRAVRVSV